MSKSDIARDVRNGISGKAERSLAWKGGRYKTSSGYMVVYAPNHPNCNSKGYVREARLIAERTLGRLLKKDEHTHHINGIKDDNREENIQVMGINEHLSLENSGEKNNFYGKKHTLESKKKIREARKKQVGENRPFWGRKHSEETKRKISETKRRRLAFL